MEHVAGAAPRIFQQSIPVAFHASIRRARMNEQANARADRSAQ